MAQVLVDRADLVALKALADKLAALPDYVPPVTPPPAPSGSVYHGVTNHEAPWKMADLDTFEADAGRKVAILSYFIGYKQANPPEIDRLQAIAARGAVPMVTWEWSIPGLKLSDITAGKYDADIHLWAKTLKTFGGPVLLRWGHEMNGSWYPWCVGVNGNTAQQYQQAWWRIQGTIRGDGASNVQFVWSPNIVPAGAAFAPMFPGDANVDWIALDGYNWSGVKSAPWLSFTQVFGASYAAIIALSSKPLMIAEWGCVEAGGDKGAWLKSALQSEIPAMPRIKAAVYFNNAYDNANWPIESSVGATAGYKAGVAGYKASWP